MRVVVTGGAGFIGSHVVELFARKGNDVLILDDLSTGRMEWIQPILLKRKNHVAFDLCDIRNFDHLNCAFAEFHPNLICHLAAQPAISISWEDPALNAQVNELGTLNLINAAKGYNARFIMASTSAVYRCNRHVLREDMPCLPDSPYGISKLAAENYVRTLCREGIVLRLGNVYGPRQVPLGKNQLVPLILRHFLYGDPFAIFGNGEQRRDFVYVEDVADAFLMAAWGKPGIYNVASGDSVPVNEVAGILSGLYGSRDYEWDHTDQPDARQEVLMDVTAAANGLSWCSTHSLKDGLLMTAEWWNNRK